jgi:hypothetical protein
VSFRVYEVIRDGQPTREFALKTRVMKIKVGGLAKRARTLPP